MIHIEKTTGKSYPIIEMTDEHLKKVIEFYIDLLEKIDFDSNITYIVEFEKALNRFMPYLFVAIGVGVFNPIHKIKIEEIYKNYVKHKSRESRELLPQVWDSNLIS